MLTKLEQLTLAVEAARVDIAPEYKDYLELALAIATSCGEEGRACFHRICAFHHDYEHARADKFFTNLLRCNRGRVTLGTAFHLARQAGVTVAHQVAGCKVAATPHTQARVREEENLETEECIIEELQAGCEPNAPLPYFPEYARFGQGHAGIESRHRQELAASCCPQRACGAWYGKRHVSLSRARVYVRDACNHATCNLIYHSQILQCNMKQPLIKFYGKSELAMLYSPGFSPMVARKRLAYWISCYPGLRERLAASGGKYAHFFTPAQVQMLFEALGEP